MITRDMDKIHKYELDMLKLFAEICDKHGLRYYLAGGTLLGAIRHQGFIPWDDDIDVLMPRPDYDRFLEYAEEVAESGRYFLASLEQGTLLRPYARIFDKHTHMTPVNYIDPLETHLWIDILPLDGIPDSEAETKKLFRRSLFWRKMLQIEKSKLENSKTLTKRIIKTIMRLPLDMLGQKRTADIINNMCRKYDFDACEYIGGSAMGYGPQEKMPKAEYIPVVKVMFEGEEFSAPANWDYYLSRLYGDYMQLPPEEKRIIHPMDITFDEE